MDHRHIRGGGMGPQAVPSDDQNRCEVRQIPKLAVSITMGAIKSKDGHLQEPVTASENQLTGQTK